MSIDNIVKLLKSNIEADNILAHEYLEGWEQINDKLAPYNLSIDYFFNRKFMHIYNNDSQPTKIKVINLYRNGPTEYY